MRVGPIARHDLAACVAARKSVPAPVSVPAPPAPRPRDDYASFLQTENAKHHAERLTYSDALEARRIAVRAAADAARPAATEPTPSQPLDAHRPAKKAARDATAPSAPATPRAIDTPYRVSVETVTSSGSLIDILL